MASPVMEQCIKKDEYFHSVLCLPNQSCHWHVLATDGIVNDMAIMVWWSEVWKQPSQHENQATSDCARGQ